MEVAAFLQTINQSLVATRRPRRLQKFIFFFFVAFLLDMDMLLAVKLKSIVAQKRDTYLILIYLVCENNASEPQHQYVYVLPCFNNKKTINFSDAMCDRHITYHFIMCTFFSHFFLFGSFLRECRSPPFIRCYLIHSIYLLAGRLLSIDTNHRHIDRNDMD